MSGVLTSSAEETINMGQWMANEVLEGLGERNGARVLALVGQLGAGKTTFIQGLARGLGITDDIQSPTFVLFKEYFIPNVVDHQPTTLTHVDVYRMDDPEDLRDLGFQEMLADSSRVIVVEWAERLRGMLPDDAVWIEFHHVTNDQRRIVIHDFSDKQ